MMELVLLALCFSGAFLILFFTSKKGDSGRIPCLVAFLIWVLYAAYEGIYIPQWMKTIYGAPIRVDLFLFLPALTVISVVAFTRFARRSRRKGEEDSISAATELLHAARYAQHEDDVERAAGLYRKLIEEFPSTVEAKAASENLRRLLGRE